MRTGASPRTHRGRFAYGHREDGGTGILGEALCYPIDHFGCFRPEHIGRVADDEIRFLRRHLASGVPA
jgi:hypothetical protein